MLASERKCAQPLARPVIGKMNHFAAKCRQKPQLSSVKIEEEQYSGDETFYASTTVT